MRRFGIAWRLVLMVLLGAGAVLLVVFGYSYLTARHLLEEEMVGRVMEQAAAAAYRVEAFQVSVEKAAEGVALTMEVDPPERDEMLYRLLEGVLSSNDGMVGASVVSAPGAAIAETVDDGLAVDRLGAHFMRRKLGAQVTAFRLDDPYMMPSNMQKPVWTEPYFGEGEETVLATYAVPFYLAGADGGPARLGGVVACDVSLDWLTDTVNAVPLGKDGYGFILSQNGTFIAHPMRTLIVRETVFSIAEARGDANLRAVGRKMVRGETGMAPIVAIVNGLKSWMAYAPVPTTGWSLTLVLPQRELMDKVLSFSRTQVLAGGAGLLLLLVVAFFIARGITAPLVRLSSATLDLAEDLDAPLPEPKGRDEVAELGRSFGRMRDELRRRVAELAETTAARERIESELRLAADIQQSLIPKTFPPLPNLPEVDLFAVLEPAREVGGDFYDFFFLDEHRLCFSVADISGKGVPAALFMVATRSFLRSLMREEQSVATALERLNDELESENEACMFVTLFCGVLDLTTGQCFYANAGHNSPLVVTSDGAVRAIERPRGVILGVQQGLRYQEGELFLPLGDCLILYTDGVTEAMNEDEQLFGDARLREVVVEGAGGDCRHHVDRIRREVAAFAGAAEQSDDITVLAIRRIDVESADAEGSATADPAAATVDITGDQGAVPHLTEKETR